MRPEARDAAYLWDMLEAASVVREFVSGVESERQYVRDRKLQLAIERAVEIIGEAARQVSEPFRGAHPEIPWRAIIAQRNVLAHEYGDIKQELMWNVAKVRVPDLIAKLEALLPNLPPKVGE